MRIVITAGPTREFFDSVRFISNPSSGRMGFALAAEARRRGHDVVLVSGPVEIAPPRGIKAVFVVSAAEMFDRTVAAFAKADGAILTAAVCDYRPSRRIEHKLKKSARPRRIVLKATRDIAAHLGRIKKRRPIITFAMEDHDHHRHAERKLKKKRCDAVVLNGPGNIGSNRATVEILRADGGWSEPIDGSKRQVAGHVVRLLERLAGGAD